jgi:hypothetical protein
VNEPSEIENAGHPNNNGFDYWFGYMNQGNAHNYYPPFLWENKTQVPLAGNVLIRNHPHARGRVSSERVTYSHDLLTDHASAFWDFLRLTVSLRGRKQGAPVGTPSRDTLANRIPGQVRPADQVT